MKQVGLLSAYTKREMLLFTCVPINSNLILTFRGLIMSGL